MAQPKFAAKSKASHGLIPKPHYLSHLAYDAKQQPHPIRHFPQCTGQTDARTDTRTDRPRESLMTIGCYASYESDAA